MPYMTCMEEGCTNRVHLPHHVADDSDLVWVRCNDCAQKMKKSKAEIKKKEKKIKQIEKMSVEELQDYFTNHLNEIKIPESFTALVKRILKLENENEQLREACKEYNVPI